MVCLVSILEKTDRVITAPHWICMFIEVMVVAEYGGNNWFDGLTLASFCIVPTVWNPSTPASFLKCIEC